MSDGKDSRSDTNASTPRPGSVSAFDTGDPVRLARELHEVAAERDRLRLELETLRGKQTLIEALDSILEAIVIYDADGRLVVCNENFRSLYGYSEEEAKPGVHFRELGRIDIERGNVAVGDEYGDGEDYLARKAEYRRKLEGSFVVQLKDGRWIKTIDRRVRGGGFASIQVDITEVKTLEQKMRHMAQHDALTGLPNRRLFMEQGRLLVENAARGRDRLAVLFIDIDDFKAINDALGHQVGDRVLKLIGERMKARMRASDIVARLGGDEFAVLLGKSDAAAASIVADSLIEDVGRPIAVDGRDIVLGISIGIACHPGDGGDIESLLNRSDKALYAAKSGGKGRWCRPD